MKVLICGDRFWKNKVMMRSVIHLANDLRRINLIIHGGATGADTMAGQIAKDLDIPVKVFPAPWNEIEDKPPMQIRTRQNGEKYWVGAGPYRNRQMLKEKPDLVIAFHSNIALSRGTKDMVEIANKAGIPVWLYGIGKNE